MSSRLRDFAVDLSRKVPHVDADYTSIGCLYLDFGSSLGVGRLLALSVLAGIR